MREEELIKLGQLIRSKRESQGLTQFELAEKSNVDRNYIGMLERGERNPAENCSGARHSCKPVN